MMLVRMLTLTSKSAVFSAILSILFAGVAYSALPLTGKADVTTPSYEKVAQSPVDETFCDVGSSANHWDPSAKHPQAEGCRAKRNGGYVWGMTAVNENLWFGTVNNGWCGWLLVTGVFVPTETDKWVCESSMSHFPKQRNEEGNLLYPKNGALLQADWRPPSIYRFNTGDSTLDKVTSDNPKLDQLLHRSFGFRGAGTLGDLVFMAANPIDSSERKVFILAFNGKSGAFIDGVEIAGYSNLRKLEIIRDPKGQAGLYLFAGSNINAKELSPTHLLRWTGSPDAPFGNDPSDATPGFDVVGALGSIGIGAEMIEHRGRIIFTTWGSNSQAAGLYMTNEVPVGGFTPANPARFQNIFGADDFDPDPVNADGWLGGALGELDGSVVWGTMHPNGMSYHALAAVYPELVGDDRAIKHSHRRTHLFKTNLEDVDNPATEVLYGEAKLMAYDKGHWIEKPNRLDQIPTLGASGYGEFLNDYTWTIVKWNKSLYIGTFDVSGGVESLIRSDIEKKDAHVLHTLGTELQHWDYTPGFDLFRMDSTERPVQAVTIDGFANRSSNGIRNAIVVENSLYLGTSTYSNLDLQNGGWELYRLTSK